MTEPGADLPRKDIAVRQQATPLVDAKSGDREVEENLSAKKFVEAVRKRLLSSDAATFDLPADVNQGGNRKTRFLVISSEDGGHISVNARYHPNSDFAKEMVDVRWFDEAQSRSGLVESMDNWADPERHIDRTYIRDIPSGDLQKEFAFWQMSGGYDYGSSLRGRPMSDDDLGALADMIDDGYLDPDMTDAAAKFVIAQGGRRIEPEQTAGDTSDKVSLPPTETKAITSE